jgi:gamma-tubulin complex component 3
VVVGAVSTLVSYFNLITSLAFKYSDIAGLERSIDAAYQIASKRLFDVFFDKFNLLDHLLALKHYLMLGHGDFADHLMEALACVSLFSANG